MWLYVPNSTSSASAEGSSDWTLDYISLSKALARSVSLNGKLRASNLWLKDLKREVFPNSRSGLTSPPSTVARGAESFIASLRDFHVSHIQSPVSDAAIPTSGPSGMNSLEWWEKCSRSWYSSKMSLSFSDTLDQSERNYRSWATQLRSRCSLQRVSAGHLMSASASLSSRGGRAPSDPLDSRWPTPRTISGGAESAERKRELGREESGGGDLQDMAGKWATPNTPTGGRNMEAHLVAAKGKTDKGKRQVPLQGQAQHWGTPTSRDHKDGASRDNREGRGDNGLVSLQVLDFHCSPPGQETPSGQSCWCGIPLCDQPSHKRRLNPLFCILMMSWPIWWLSPASPCYAPREMASWLQRQRWHSRYLLSVRGYLNRCRLCESLVLSGQGECPVCGVDGPHARID